MKKLLLFVLGAFFLGTNLNANEPVPLTVSGDIDDMPLGNGYGRAPMLAPRVYIDDYTLLFSVDHPEYVLYIKDEDDNVVYSTVVYSDQTQVVLPSTLSGDYQIELVMGIWKFTGWINL